MAGVRIYKIFVSGCYDYASRGMDAISDSPDPVVCLSYLFVWEGEGVLGLIVLQSDRSRIKLMVGFSTHGVVDKT